MSDSLHFYKQQIIEVLRNDENCKPWQKRVNNAIVALILISTFEIFLSTYQDISNRFALILKIVNYATTVIFTIEVTLRIWLAGEVDERFKGKWGRLKYCFSFYGLIDILATYPFYLQFFTTVPYMALKALRVARLLRIFRYVKGFQLLSKAMQSKKHEMAVSGEVLCVITVLLSFILFFVEHEAQPEVYTNGWKSVLWAFAQYIGDPGHFADTPPITVGGRIIACFIGVLGIAIFAVPAGLVASAFSEVMDQEKSDARDRENAQRIRNSRYVHSSLLKNVRFWPKDFYRFNDIKVNLDLMDEEILQAVRFAPDLRLRDMSSCLDGSHGNKPEQMAVEMQYMNRSYGFCSLFPYEDFPKFQSNVTLICPEGASDECIAYVTYQMARIGHFNAIINEVLSSSADEAENRCIIRGIYDYQYNNPTDYPKLHEFVDDIHQSICEHDDWVIVLSRKTAPKGDDIHQKIRLVVNVAENKDDNTLADCITVNDTKKLQDFYDDLCASMKQSQGIEPVISYTKYKTTRVPQYIRDHIDGTPNVIELELSRDYIVFGLDVTKKTDSYKTLSEVIHRHFETKNDWNTENWKAADCRMYRSSCIPTHKGEQ